MAESQPLKEPEWASANPTDGTSGQPAILEPTEAKKDSGHLRLERPTRQDHNWLFNLIWLWIKYFKQVFVDTTTRAGVTLTNSDDVITGLDTWHLDRNFISGFHFMNVVNNTTTDTEITISKGKAFAQNGNFMIDSALSTTPFPVGGFIKDIRSGGAPYSKGSGNQGLADGVTYGTNQPYFVFLVHFTDGEVDFAYDDVAAGTNVAALAGVDFYRRIGCIYQRSIVGIMHMRSIGDHFFFVDESYGFIEGSLSVTDVSPSGSIPINIFTGIDYVVDTQYRINWSGGVGAERLYISGPLEDITAFTADDRRSSSINNPAGKSENGSQRMLFDSLGTSVQLNLINTVGATTADVSIHFRSWIDLRGKDWESGPSGAIQGRYF